MINNDEMSKRSSYDARLFFSKYLVDILRTLSLSHYSEGTRLNIEDKHELIIEYYLATSCFLNKKINDKIQELINKNTSLLDLIKLKSNSDTDLKIQKNLATSNLYKIRMIVQQETSHLLLPIKEEEDDDSDLDESIL